MDIPISSYIIAKFMLEEVIMTEKKYYVHRDN